MFSLYRVTLLFLTISVSGLCHAADSHLRILGVGNSFTRNATRYLPALVDADPAVSVEVGLAYIGGCPLDKHVNLADAHEADSSKGCSYKYSINGKTVKNNASLKEMLLDGEWDYITIQQVSTKSYKIDSYYPYAERLINYIKQYAPDAEIIIHETWSHSIDSYRAREWGLDPDVMYTQLHAAYRQIGEEFGLQIIPVGTAFQNAKKQPHWDYQATEVDVKALHYPEDKDNLPDQSKSLHSIFSWAKSKDGQWSVKNDGFHANRNGELLGSLVWYEFFFNKDARDLSYQAEWLSADQMESLASVAHDTVATSRAE